VKTSDELFDAFADQRSPPVMRILRMPKLRKILARRRSSGQENLVVVAIVLRIGGSTVDAAEVAAVRNGDAEVGDLAPNLS